MELSARCGRSGGGGGGSVEKEHMFDKVVTPSDVGKLNRLVIPKQHAEKYFPLNSSSTEKGLILNFEDRNGKAWPFGYSYWSSSQSYVMTKGWSRFVKEKKLNAGDVVSFQRGVGEPGRLYIDWRRRPNPLELTPMQFQFQFPREMRWGRLLNPTAHPFENFRNLMNYNLYPYHCSFQQKRHEPMMVINSVPVVHGAKTMAPIKRLRLFGVNMECCSPSIQDESNSNGTMGSVIYTPSASSSLPPVELRLPSSGPLATMQAELSTKGKSSTSFDLDL